MTLVPAARQDDAASGVHRIAAVMRNFSVEATRPNAGDFDAAQEALPAHSHVYLSAVAGHSDAQAIAQAAQARARGFEPVPHIAARNIASAAELCTLLAGFAREAKVRRVLVISGDRDRPEGPFAKALDVIESGLLQQHEIEEVGIAGYPEGHPRIAPDALDLAMAAKIVAAEETGLQIHIVTQFSFDPGTILEWLGRLRNRGVDVPVRIGMAGPTSLATMLRFAQRCGVAASARGLTRQAGLLKHLVGTSAPDAIVRALAESELSALGDVTPHFYSFGGLGATARWAAAVAAGRITLDRAGGFEVSAP
jgi:methylenetetrahydrofolate reductase (NADPH)